MTEPKDTDAIVIGAGFSGLLAARELWRASLGGQVLQARTARTRADGRVSSRDVPGVTPPAEYGAEFMEGPGSVSQELLKEAGGQDWQAQTGRLLPAEPFQHRLEQTLARLPQGGPDRTLLRALASSNLGPDLAQASEEARRYVEGFDAAPADRVSLHWVREVESNESGTGRVPQFYTLGGNDHLARHLARELGDRVSLGAVVREVRWSRSRVEAGYQQDGQTQRLRAMVAVTTVPIGVWRVPPGAEWAVKFTPEMTAQRDAARRLAMGSVLKLTLQFRTRFWEGRCLDRLRGG